MLRIKFDLEEKFKAYENITVKSNQSGKFRIGIMQPLIAVNVRGDSMLILIYKKSVFQS